MTPSYKLDFQLDPNDLQKLRTEIKTNLVENQSVNNLRTVQSRVDNKNKQKHNFDGKKHKRNNKVDKGRGTASSKGKLGKHLSEYRRLYLMITWWLQLWQISTV